MCVCVLKRAICTITLTVLGVPCSSQVTDGGLLALAALRQLGSLDLSGCVSLSERGLAAITARLRRLHTLKLGGTSRVATISDASVAAIAGLTSLTHLDLSGSHDITDAGALESSPLPSIKDGFESGARMCATMRCCERL